MLKDSLDFSQVVTNYKFRNLMRPGITGMSQVRGCRGPATTFASIFRRYQWDAYYVRNVNFWLDAKIMLETAMMMVKSVLQKGRHEPEKQSVPSNDLLIASKKIA
jgi:putative colanic acid biosynthesis UDP-glucose lipid carrier transferase